MPRPFIPIAQKLMNYSPEPMSGCWIWLGTEAQTTVGPYGRMHIGNGKWQYSHILSYEDAHGPVPEGLELDHKCRNTLCMNPDHLEAVTHKENVRRGRCKDIWERYRNKKFCSRGHDLSVVGMTTVHYRGCNQYRCDECERIRGRKRRAK